jgi:hypothetical protein
LREYIKVCKHVGGQRLGAKFCAATRDAQLKLEANSVSDDMMSLNRLFSRAHAMSIHLNLITIGATLVYGWRLTTKIGFDVV